MNRVYAHQGDSVDLICLRQYGKTAGITEAVLEANPRLADFGPILPHGTPVDLPDVPPQAEEKTVQLWD